MKHLLFAAAALFTSSALASVDPIVIKGSKFFYKTNGTQFYIRGMAYQEPYNGTSNTGLTSDEFNDPLADATTCARDIPYMVKARTNTIRVYAVDPTVDHSDCMNLLADAGIYALIDLGSPSLSINRDDPSWDLSLYTRYKNVVDAFANYTNTLGFFAGNEVTNSDNTTAASAFVKAAVRDTKAYITSQGYRSIGVGYAAADVSSIRTQLAHYFNCGDDADTVDFFGDNVYEWCGDSATYKSSGYSKITAEFSNYSVPYFFAEYGCITVKPRTFKNIAAMYGEDMEDWLNGGLVYEYFQDTNEYGLVTVSGDSVTTLTAYSSYSKAIASATPTGTNKASYTPTNTVKASCPTTDSTWLAPTDLPPTPDAELCTCMMKSLTCVLKESVSTSKYSDLFSTVCGYDACAGINTNSSAGSFGAYGMCTNRQKLSFAMDTYYKAQDEDSSACDFDGAATTQSATTATGTCSTLLKEVGTAGTGTVTSVATGTSDSSSSSSTSTSSSNGAAFPATPAAITVGSWQLRAYIVTAVFSVMGMVFL